MRTVEELRAVILAWRVNPKESDNQYVDVLLDILDHLEESSVVIKPSP